LLVVLQQKKVAKEAAKKAIPTKIKTATKTYTVKKTPTGKVKVTNPSTGLSVKFPRNADLSARNIKVAGAKKALAKSVAKEKAKEGRRRSRSSNRCRCSKGSKKC
jgi:hypothetical protein